MRIIVQGYRLNFLYLGKPLRKILVSQRVRFGEIENVACRAKIYWPRLRFHLEIERKEGPVNGEGFLAGFRADMQCHWRSTTTEKGAIVVMRGYPNNAGSWETIPPDQFPDFERNLPLKRLLFKATGVG